jgi:hypothetical protein
MPIKGIPLVILVFAALALGGWSSFSLFRFLAQNVREARVLKDTVFVQFVNGQPYHSDAGLRADTPKAGLASAFKTNLPDTGHPISGYRSPDSLYLRPPAVVAVPADSVKNALASAKLTQASFPWSIIVFAALLVVATAAVMVYSRLPYLAVDLQKDLDPEDLTNLFQRFGENIEEIGNPRKIKRLSNKIRFQYHYLTSKGWKDAYALEALVAILLDLEKKPWVKNDVQPVDSPNFAPDEVFYQQYFKRAAANPAFRDEKLMRLIYTLNRDRV